jgi:hypothetical protein
MTEFHQPFIKNLVFVGLVTIVSMISAKFFVENYIYLTKNTPVYTTRQSHIYIDHDNIKSINPSSR